MIGKIPSKRSDGKSSFHALVSCCTAKERADILYICAQNILSLENVAAEMEALAFNNTRSKEELRSNVILSKTSPSAALSPLNAVAVTPTSSFDVSPPIKPSSVTVS
ncbi:hypothetical protein FACS1894167_09080 [Synergistales bacterium]|nr:hypothetical protein FACS1894167_09080 [Synergistales bacterium]